MRRGERNRATISGRARWEQAVAIRDWADREAGPSGQGGKSTPPDQEAGRGIAAAFRLAQHPSLSPAVCDCRAPARGEAFLNLLKHRLTGNGLYLFDEPEAALSPARQLSVLVLLHDLLLNASQIVIATHSPILMAYPHAKIIEVSASGLREVAYTETDHFRITRDFLLRHERMLGHLLADDAPTT
jgi:hypothetical protein